MLLLTDYLSRQVRLTQERLTHLLKHPEMGDQLTRVEETLSHPELVVSTIADPNVHVYHHYYSTTPVTSKYLLVAVKYEAGDTFVLTAFFSNRPKRGKVIWQK